VRGFINDRQPAARHFKRHKDQVLQRPTSLYLAVAIVTFLDNFQIMKIALSILLSFIFVLKSYGQDLSPDFKTISVNKKIREFPDQFDLSSPLNSFVTLKYIYINGKNRLLRSVNTIKNKLLFPDSSAQNSQVSEEKKNKYLNTIILEIIIYKDSIAFVINEDEESYYSVRSFYLELGNWVSSGESVLNSVEEARQFISDRAMLFFQDFRMVQKSLL
jgi:hypothetical protein